MGEVFGLAAIACARANALFADFLPIGEKVGVGDYPDSLRASAGMTYSQSLSDPVTVTCMLDAHEDMRVDNIVCAGCLALSRFLTCKSL